MGYGGGGYGLGVEMGWWDMGGYGFRPDLGADMGRADLGSRTANDTLEIRLGSISVYLRNKMRTEFLVRNLSLSDSDSDFCIRVYLIKNENNVK